MKWVSKHLRELEVGLERVQVELMAIRLLIDATFMVDPTIGFMTTHTSKQFYKCLRESVQLQNHKRKRLPSTWS
jgi:hypothetical protein